MTAISYLGQRQQSLLTVLLHHREGLTIDELSGKLDISRNAVNQHLANLIGSGFIQSTLLDSTGGRPSKVFTLTPSGLELFPRHYAFLARVLLSWLEKNLGPQALETCLKELGEQFAQEFTNRVNKQQSQTGKVNETTIILRELGYDANVTINTGHYAEIVANNCVFHKLAQECHGVCTLDLSLMTSLLNADIEHKKCIAKGGEHCCFAIQMTKASTHTA